MSGAITFTGKELYTQDQNSKSWLFSGGFVLAVAVGHAILFTSIMAVPSHGFTTGGFSTMLSIVGGCQGAAATAGLIFLAIGYCKKRKVESLMQQHGFAPQPQDSELRILPSE